MSARLIKVGQRIEARAFPVFAIPAHDGQEMIVRSVSLQVTPQNTHSDDPEVEASKIIADAKDQAAGIARQAHQEGRATLEAEIAAGVALIVDPWCQELAKTLDEISGLRAAITEQAEADLVKLALEIAKKVVHREVTIDKEIVVTLAGIGLSRVHDRTAAAIHLHPEDFAYLSSQRERIETGHVLELIEDRSISRGGCLIHTEMGDVDARIEQQFAEIERAFLET
jgi:flagellar assembly protein FliH